MMSATVKLFDPGRVRDEMRASEQDATNLHRRLQSMILKITVCTECSYIVRTKFPQHTERLHQALMWGFEQPDSWWEQFLLWSVQSKSAA